MNHFDMELSLIPEDSKNYLFFKHMHKKLGSDFVCANLRKQACESRGHLNESMQRCFENLILMDAVAKCIDCTPEIKDKHGSLLFQTSNKANDAGNHPLYLNTIKLHAGQSKITEELKLLGIDQEFISKITENKKTQKETLRLTTLVENYITEFCRKVISFSGRYDGLANTKNTFQKTMKDLSLIATLLVARKSILQPKETDVQEMLSTYYKELSEGLSILRQLITLHEEKLKFELGLAQFYSQKCQALYLKFRLFEVNVLMATYSKKTLQALSIISTKLDAKEEMLLKEKDDKKTTLQAYQILGPRYEELVKEYTKLMKDIQKQKWSIETLKETKDT